MTRMLARKFLIQDGASQQELQEFDMLSNEQFDLWWDTNGRHYYSGREIRV